MKVYCVCIEEYIHVEDVYRVEVFSTLEAAERYLDDLTDGGTLDEIRGDVVEYTLDEPESGDTCFVIEGTASASASGDYSD
jgi:hypothetical protein